MSETTDALRRELDDLTERYRDLVPAVLEARRELEGAEAAEAEARREARTRHALNELTDDELRGEEEAITKRLDDLRSEAERMEDAAQGVGERAEAKGAELAAAIRAEAAAPVAEVDAKLRPLLAQVDALQRLRAARVADQREAEMRARGVEDEAVLPTSRARLEERRQRQRQHEDWRKRHPEQAGAALRPHYGTPPTREVNRL